MAVKKAKPTKRLKKAKKMEAQKPLLTDTSGKKYF